MGNLEIVTSKAFAGMAGPWVARVKTQGGKETWRRHRGEAYQHLSPNPGRQVVEEQDKDKCLSVTGSGSADIFHDI